jgi:ribosomal protein L37AE/L43A
MRGDNIKSWRKSNKYKCSSCGNVARRKPGEPFILGCAKCNIYAAKPSVQFTEIAS